MGILVEMEGDDIFRFELQTTLIVNRLHDYGTCLNYVINSAVLSRSTFNYVVHI